MTGVLDKAGWRELLLSRRRAVPVAERERDAARLAVAVVDACAGRPAGPVCAFVPVGAEPGSPAMLDALRGAGREVLLPVVPNGPGALGWGRYLGAASLVRGPLGLRQPSGPDLGPDAIGGAVLVLVPALAVDRRGVRLGRGGGWYDRTLPLATPGTPLLAVVRDDEVVDRLPGEPHDVPVNGALTPLGGVTLLS
jgi:5-formyltetrahydrofolate cyclo-ligase